MMAVSLNHTIVFSRDPDASAAFLADLLGLEAPGHYGPFTVVETANGVSMDYMKVDDEPLFAHYAFLVSEDEFDAIFGRIRDRGLEYWADPYHHHAGEMNHGHGGRGVYFEDADGHNLEILTRPYGSGD
jgi:catechol 2,3-dioxygenase-like lactoylglutathione lyase family enzyme